MSVEQGPWFWGSEGEKERLVTSTTDNKEGKLKKKKKSNAFVNKCRAYLSSKAFNIRTEDEVICDTSLNCCCNM